MVITCTSEEVADLINVLKGQPLSLIIESKKDDSVSADCFSCPCPGVLLDPENVRQATCDRVQEFLSSYRRNMRSCVK